MAYLAYLSNNGIEAELEDTGPSKFSFVTEDIKAEPLFAFEAGCHCLQRFPKMIVAGKITSYVAVNVIKLQQQDSQMRESDLEESFQRGHGKGGQNQNKVSSAVRLRHKTHQSRSFHQWQESTG